MVGSFRLATTVARLEVAGQVDTDRPPSRADWPNGCT